MLLDHTGAMLNHRRLDRYILTIDLGAVRVARRATEALAHPVIATVNLATLAMDVSPLAVIHIHTEEIKLIAACYLATCATTVTNERFRRTPHHPVGHIHLVHMLLADMIARHLGKVEPVTCKKFRITHTWLA